MKIRQKPNLIDIPVTPMCSLPMGKLFYMDFKYDDKPIVKKIINQIFSDIDPFGEEDWDN